LRDDLKFFLIGTRRSKRTKGGIKRAKKYHRLCAVVLVFHNLIRSNGDMITTHDSFKIFKQKKANITTFTMVGGQKQDNAFGQEEIP
jgi:hypothetical protein